MEHVRLSRRRYLTTAGATLTAGVAGCLGQSYDGEAANEIEYETTENADVDVPLVPIADALEWYESDEAVFVDTRGETAFEAARIEGAIHSEAPEGPDDDDPIEQFDTDTRLVTYCDCPHHLATLRGAALIGDEYAHTYAIDEGFVPWRENEYPMEGEDVEVEPAVYRIDGRTDPGHAGAYAWAWHDGTGQREATPIDETGRFTLALRFYDLESDSRIRITTPDGEIADEVGALIDHEVRV